jgi:uncharacterized paraquat-inducible protein A
MPMLVVLLTFAFYCISKAQVTKFYHFTKAQDQQFTKAIEYELQRWLSQLKVRCTKFTLTLLLIVYPSVSRTILLTFKLRGPIEGINYIEADMRLPAEGPAYAAAAVWAFLMVLLYPIGILAMCLLIVWKYRDHLHEPKVQRRFGMLYEGVSFTTNSARIAHKLLTICCLFCSMNIDVGITKV